MSRIHGNPGGNSSQRAFSAHSKIELCKRGEEEQYRCAFAELKDSKSIACAVAEMNSEPSKYPDNAYMVFSSQADAFFVVYKPGGLRDVRHNIENVHDCKPGGDGDVTDVSTSDASDQSEKDGWNSEPESDKMLEKGPDVEMKYGAFDHPLCKAQKHRFLHTINCRDVDAANNTIDWLDKESAELRTESATAKQQVGELEIQNAELKAENVTLKRRLATMLVKDEANKRIKKELKEVIRRVASEKVTGYVQLSDAHAEKIVAEASASPGLVQWLNSLVASS